MTDGQLRMRIHLVESNPALRADLARAIASAGYEVTEASAFPAADREVAAQRGLHVVDLEAPGAVAWAAQSGAIDRSLFLASDADRAQALARSLGRDLDLLVKPFSFQTLERRILRRLSAIDDSRFDRIDPLLRTRDPGVARTFTRAARAAQTEIPISIAGELGTGRRALARAIHAASARAAGAIVVLERSDFDERPDASRDASLSERVAAAAGGTLVVVEPGDWPAWAQHELRRRLREAEPGEEPRCITLLRAPTDCGPEAGEGRIPSELQYRLDGITLALPPLRERTADHFDLCTALLRRVARELGQLAGPIDPALVERLAQEGFPGNRLGLESRLRSALIRSEGERSIAGMLEGELESARRAESRPVSLDLKALERDTIIRALAHVRGNRTHASQALGISVRTLRNKIREYGLR